MSDELWKEFHNLHLPELHYEWYVREDVFKPFMTW